MLCNYSGRYNSGISAGCSVRFELFPSSLGWTTHIDLQQRAKHFAFFFCDDDASGGGVGDQWQKCDGNVKPVS